jgi:pimeloyl-ACP methyl ester carboxylesterase
MDLRGHGLSDKPAHGYELARHVEDVRGLLRALRLQRPVLLGFSMGGAIAAAVAAREEVSGLVLLDAIIGDRAFTENAVADVRHVVANAVGRRFGGFAEYLAHWRGLRGWSDAAERQLARTVRYELSPLADGTYRRRTIRSALEETWLSLPDADSLNVIAGLRCPILIVHAARPWPGNQPYLPDAVIDEQLRAAPHARRFEARHSTHPMLVRDPEPELAETIQMFVRTHADPTAARVGPAA